MSLIFLFMCPTRDVERDKNKQVSIIENPTLAISLTTCFRYYKFASCFFLGKMKKQSNKSGSWKKHFVQCTLSR